MRCRVVIAITYDIVWFNARRRCVRRTLKMMSSRLFRRRAGLAHFETLYPEKSSVYFISFIFLGAHYYYISFAKSPNPYPKNPNFQLFSPPPFFFLGGGAILYLTNRNYAHLDRKWNVDSLNRWLLCDVWMVLIQVYWLIPFFYTCFRKTCGMKSFWLH